MNGADAAPLFKWLKDELRTPTGGEKDTKVTREPAEKPRAPSGALALSASGGCADARVHVAQGNGVIDDDALVLPRGGFGGTTVVLWTPVSRADIAWNFEAPR